MQISREQALEYLRQWHERSIQVGLCFSVPGADAGLTMLARITEISVRIVLANPDTTLRYSLTNARFEYGPLQVLSLPLNLGPAVALTHLPQGLIAKEGVHIRLESGLSLFLFDAEELGKHWLNLTASSIEGIDSGGLLRSKPSEASFSF